MSASMFDYTFNNTARISSDTTDNTEQNLQNVRYANHCLTGLYKDNITTQDLDFASSQPTMTMYGLAGGNGLIGQAIEMNNKLFKETEQERAFHKLSLVQRPFLTVPYLGRGSVNPTLESKLQQGENVFEKKSVSTIMDKSFLKYKLDPNYENSPQATAENVALTGWDIGGVPTRTTNDLSVKK